MVDSNFAKYLANQIRMGQLDKEQVLATYPDCADKINEYLLEFEIIPTVTE